jgi:hypothetical protein
VPINSMPRIRLRTIFLLVSCVAVGLAADPDPLGALEPIIQAVMAVGLVQQIRTLVKWQPAQLPVVNEVRFSRWFAISWRAAIALTFVCVILYSMLVSHNFVSFPDRHDGLAIEPLHDGLIYVCMLVVICNSLVRWRPAPRNSGQSAFYSTLLWLAGLGLTGLVLLDATITQFLVHRGLANIEASQPQHLHRQGVYIPLSADAYLPLWFGLGAAVSLFAALLITISPHKLTLNKSRYSIRLLVFVILMIVPTAYCWWWYAYEFPRLSPDIAGVGLALTRFDLVCGIGVALALVAASSYRLAMTPSTKVIIRANMAEDIDRTAFHESLPTLVLFILIGVSFIVWLITSLYTAPWQSAVRNVITFVSTICYPPFLLPLAITIAGLQLCWIRWRSRSEIVPDVLIGLSPTRFVASSLMIAWILAAGVPALRAFAFTAWVGPYDLLPLFRL